MNRLWLLLVGVAVTLTAVPARAADLPQASTGTAEIALPARIDSLEVRGLWRTQRGVVERELPWRVGEVVPAELWREGLAKLWNMGLFSRVSAQLEHREGRHIAVVTVEERWTLNPLFSFAVLVRRDGKPGESSSWWSVGAEDTNVLGQFLDVAAAYEQFNQYSGGRVWLRDPRWLGRRLDALIQWDYLVRPRVGFADRRMLLRAELNHLFDGDRVKFGARLDLQRDVFFDAGDTPSALPPDGKTAILDLGLRLGRVDVQRLRQVGQSLEVRSGVGVSALVDAPGQVHTQAWLQGLGYWTLGERWNLAVRVQAGHQSANTPAHLQYFLGGLYEVRGVRDSFLRADRFALANAEVRYVAADWTWLAILPTAFVDAVVARDAERSWTTLVSAGGGVRLLVPRFVRTGLRIDVAAPLAGMPCSAGGLFGTCAGMSLGVYQFF
ncbi:MAG: hypothetical protein HY902_07170 [Deltaproteobacteria bacterium]|nr:hypothetical protein [Deltaproteobacteria bacterium]